MKTITIGERIRDLRKKRELTQERLADFLGVVKASNSRMAHSSVSSPERFSSSPYGRADTRPLRRCSGFFPRL